MKNKLIYGLLGLLIVGAIFSTGLVSAFRGDYSIKGPNYSEDREIAMNKSFDNLDYDAWYSLMTEDGRHPHVVDVITEDNFKVFVQIHEAMANGDEETASNLRSMLGLGSGSHSGHGFHNQMRNR